jgi:hypothetical protein
MANIYALMHVSDIVKDLLIINYIYRSIEDDLYIFLPLDLCGN